MSKIIADRMMVDDDEMHFRDADAQNKLKNLIVQEKGDSETAVMSQAAATKEFGRLTEDKFDKSKIAQTTGDSEDAAMSQKAATEEFDKLSEEIAEHNCINIIPVDRHTKTTSSGITFEWDGDVCHIRGTATEATVNTMCGKKDELPKRFVPEKPYYMVLESSDSNIRGQVVYYTADSANGNIISITESQLVTLPKNTVGIIFRFFVGSGKSVDGTARLRMLNAKTNTQLTEEIDAANEKIIDLQTIKLNAENTELTLGKMLDSDGKEYNSKSLADTGYIGVIPGEIIKSNIFNKDENGTSLNAYVCEYSDKSTESFIKRTYIANYVSLTVNERTRYVRFSIGYGVSSGKEFTDAEKVYFDVDITNVDINKRQQTFEKEVNARFAEWKTANYLTNVDSIRINGSTKKCGTEFVPIDDVMTPSSETPVFKKGTAYKGVPYSAIQPLSTDAFYDMSLDALFSMFNNPDSKMYGYDDPLGGASTKVYAGGVCSSFVSWITGCPVVYTTYDIRKMLDYKTINDIEDIEIGDVMICHTKDGDTQDHAMVVSNILITDNVVEAVEIAEMWKPLFRKVLYSAKQFMGLMDGTTSIGDKYRVGRFPNQKIRTIPPVVVNKDIVTEYGDNMYFEFGEDVFIQSRNTTITVKSPSGAESEVELTDLPKKTGKTVMYNIASVLNEIGRWTLYGADGEESHVTIIRKGTATLSDGTVSVSGFEGCKPCGYYTIALRNDGTGDYETHSDDPSITAAKMVAYSKDEHRYLGAMDESGVTIDTSAIANLNHIVGYYVRVCYDTGCGQAHKDTNIVYF